MRLRLDENLPKRLKQDLKEHEIYTVAEKGWHFKWQIACRCWCVGYMSKAVMTILIGERS